jgi:hypothetical protein
MNRYLFRISGIILIVLIASLPVIATLEFPNKIPVLTAYSLVIAILTGLRSFFRWEDKWRLFRGQQFALAYLIAQWEMDLSGLASDSDLGDARKEAHMKTEELLKETGEAVKREMLAFFNTTGPPEFR